jgi:OOP family OmpA-OmpF porin
MKRTAMPHIKKAHMKIQHAPGKLGVVALALFAGTVASAQGTGWYAGANVGRSAVTIDDATITTGLAGQGLAVSTIDNHDRSTGWGLFGGYQWTPNIGLEAGYFDLGHFGYTAHTTPSGTLNGTIRVKGLSLDLVGTLPLTERISAIARAGVTTIRSNDAFTAAPAARVPYANATPSERATSFNAGLGLAYAISDALSLRAEATRYGLRDAVGNKGHADLFSLGLVWRFGVQPRPVRTAAVVQAAPAPIAAPAEVVVRAAPPAPAPAPMRITLSADSLFDFDRSTLKPEGRMALDKLVGELKGVRYETLSVTGHTDRFGSHDYNMKLSMRRAETVAAYLERSGVSAARVSATGVDGANPVTAPGDCKGSKPTPAVVACLQPDRRVEVEVSGTRADAGAAK